MKTLGRRGGPTAWVLSRAIFFCGRKFSAEIARNRRKTPMTETRKSPLFTPTFVKLWLRNPNF